MSEYLLSKGLDSLSLQDVEGVTPRLSVSVIASQLNQLSMNERNFVLQDIHGVADLVVESPSLVKESLQQLKEALNARRTSIVANTTNTTQNPPPPTALMEVMQQQYLLSIDHSSPNGCPINDDDDDDAFLLSFLRADQFDVPKAADRLVRYWEEKRNLFGGNNNNSNRNIRLDDLDDESMECLECGRMQLLPRRDRAGRAVLLGVRKLQNEVRDVNSLVRNREWRR